MSYAITLVLAIFSSGIFVGNWVHSPLPCVCDYSADSSLEGVLDLVRANWIAADQNSFIATRHHRQRLRLNRSRRHTGCIPPDWWYCLASSWLVCWDCS